MTSSLSEKALTAIGTSCNRSLRRCAGPEGVVAALGVWIDCLHAPGRLDPASDPVAEIRKPLCCAGRLDQDGAPLPADAPRQVECECFLPYREGALLLGELAQAATNRGEDVLDPVRRALGLPVLRTGRWPDPFADPDEMPGWSGSGP